MATEKIILPKLCSRNGDLSKPWYVRYAVEYPLTGKKKQFRLYNGLGVTFSERQRKVNALKIIQQIKAKLHAGYQPGTGKEVSYKSLVQYDKKRRNSVITNGYDYYATQFLNNYKHLRHSSFKKYQSCIRLFVIFSKNFRKDQSEIGIYFSNHLVDVRNIKPATFNQYKQILSRFYEFLINHKITTNNPFLIIERKKVFSKPAQYINISILTEVMAKARADSYYLYVFLKFVFYMFIRPHAELRFIKISYIDFKELTLLIPGDISKNHKQATLPIPEPLAKELKYLETLPKNHYVFGYDLMPSSKPVGKNYYMNLFRLFKKAHDIPKEYSIYSFKHTGAIMAVNAGVPVKDIQMQMRHHSLDITDKYLSQMMAVDSEAIRNKMPDI